MIVVGSDVVIVGGAIRGSAWDGMVVALERSKERPPAPEASGLGADEIDTPCGVGC